MKFVEKKHSIKWCESLSTLAYGGLVILCIVPNRMKEKCDLAAACLWGSSADLPGLSKAGVIFVKSWLPVCTDLG